MNSENKLNIPIAIVVAGALIAGAVIYTNRTPAGSAGTPSRAGETVKVKPIGKDDHVLGNPNAPIVVVEYSDFECPFCKTYHATMHRIIDTYGKSGKVAWVYRQFPIPQLHSKAYLEAEASECAAELGGNDAFWKYADRIFAVTPSNDGLDTALLPDIAENIGLDRTKFTQCLESGKHRAAVEASANDAIAAGAGGTPQSYILSGKEIIPIEGAQPFEAVKAVIDSFIKESENPGVEKVPVVKP